MYPEYDPYDGSEELSWENMWTGDDEQLLEGVDCMTPFASLNPVENLVVLKLTEQEWTEMLSALYIGAEFTYPQKYLQIVANFLKGIHCPPVMVEQECYEYPTYASFLQYSPMNPFLTPDEIPDGYETVPFLVNGENGVSVPNYEHFDILVPIDALTLDVNWFEDISGQLPSITLMVEGAGKVFLKMLTYVGGGLAVITVDNPPDLLDILAGIVTSADNILDLNQDVISLPPETAQEIIYEVDIVGAGLHTIYVVFLPILDDSLIPVRFGGGFRGVQLCNFVEQPTMGIQELRFNDATCNLEQLQDGEWTVVSGWENWLDCVPSGGGGGGGGIAPKVYDIVLGANVTTTSVTFVHASTLDQAHTFTKSKALVMAVFTAQNGGGQSSIFRQRLNKGTVVYGRDAIEARTFGGAENREIVITDVFEDIPAGSHTLGIEWRVTGNTGTIFDRYNVIWTIIEFDDLSELFVEDIRINGEELQKKIGGAWVTVTDSLKTLFDAVQAAAAAAQTTANGAVTVNTAQQTQINALQTGLGNANLAIDDLDSRVTSIETIDIPQINITLSNHETRIEALEAAIGGGTWGGYNLVSETDTGLALSPSTGRYSSATNSFESGAQTGWRRRASDGKIFLSITNAHKFNSCHFVRVTIVADTYIGGSFRFRIDGQDWCDIRVSPSSARVGWARVPNASIDDMALEIECDNLSNDWRLTGLVFLCSEPLPFS